MTDPNKGTVVAILRPSKPLPEPRHRCAFEHGDDAAPVDNGMIFQCSCGKRYKCRQSYYILGYYVWVRRILPWPPKRKDI